MDAPLQPDLWSLTLPAVRAARERAREHLRSNRYIPRKAVTQYTSSSVGWSTTTAADTFFPPDSAPVNWDHMFGSDVGLFAQIKYSNVPELEAAADGVWEVAASDESFERRISLLSHSESDAESRKKQFVFEYMRFVCDIISRAEAVGVEADVDLLAIYLQLERARFANELRGDLLVPISLTPLDHAGPIELGHGVRIEKLDESMQRARAVSTMYGGRVSAHVVAASTHAVVVCDIAIDNQDPFERRYRQSGIDYEVVDRVFECLHVISSRRTGYAQAVVRPLDWADDWEHDLPAVWKVQTFERYPHEFDQGRWNEEVEPISAKELEVLPATFAALSVAPANVKLASRRAVRALLRVAEEDEVLDAAIGIEALLLADSDRDEMTHRMAQRAAVVLSVDGVDPSVVYRLVKKFYEQRSKIVHGRSWKTMNVVLEGKAYPANEVGVVLLRALLLNLFRAEVPWTPQSLDERLLSALGSNNGSGS
ncbi:HEPN domain-containing protein [Pseudonocardia sp. KRD291]|uniref:HEPN domain-containing protein n=1 Tax=Pseudonocardia sp. KRD291 TaxID=2792007 RepID=UPI001C4A14BD|nr:HEPN domain-containing protein [Pseudonocardia sp. KRD291]MBW0100908.1 hypothetical protein [Pseudonocardia sp. KRD291]